MMKTTNSSLRLRQTLQERFEFSEFRPGQEEVMSALLEGENAIAIFPTGSGKSLCYQLPALLFDGLTLVVSPLIALMKDQIDALQRRGIAAERLDSSLEEAAYRQVLSDVRCGTLKMLFVAPERLSNERFLGLIRNQKISLLAIDEAHCISSWGHNFRPDYLKLATVSKELGVERVLALTATATPRVSDDMSRAFDVKPECVVNTGFYRPNLELRVTACQDSERRGLLVDRLRSRGEGSAIVYVHRQRDAEEIADFLSSEGFIASPYHAGMKSPDRSHTQDAFMSGRVDIICATIAFGMGVDKSDIRSIYHYHLPKGFESYMQEIGRAGRDGQPSVCELFACADDCTTLENYTYGDTPDEHSLTGAVDEWLDQKDEIDVSVYAVSRKFDMRKLVVSTLLTRLELAGVIRSLGFYYSEIKFVPHVSSEEMFSHYQPNQVTFLRNLFSASRKAKKWITLDMEQAKMATGNDRATILRALADLESRELLELQTAGYRQRFALLQPDVDRGALCESLIETFAEHETMDISRIHQMLDYAEEAGCLTKKLLDYFGESISSCEHCGPCLGEPPQKLTVRQIADEQPLDLPEFEALVENYPKALGRPRQQARFLCGLNSPAVSAERSLRGHPLFGVSETVPFEHVLRGRS
jgi:ATP-dependent DNA helicase RecQ